MDNWQSYRGLLYFEAILFMVLGLVAIAVPQFFTIGVEILVGALLSAGGVVQLARSWQSWGAPGFWGILIGGILSLVLGVLFFVFPLVGVLSLTYLLIAYFFIDGITKIYYAFQLRALTRWGWVLLSGILSLLLAGLIFTGLPGTAVWVIGLLVGINMFFFGVALVALLSDKGK